MGVRTASTITTSFTIVSPDNLKSVVPGSCFRGDATITWDQIDLDFERLCEDRRFFTAVAALRNYVFDVASWRQEDIAQFVKVKQELEIELGLR